jgi:hypothetical protein
LVNSLKRTQWFDTVETCSKISIYKWGVQYIRVDSAMPKSGHWGCFWPRDLRHLMLIFWDEIWYTSSLAWPSDFELLRRDSELKYGREEPWFSWLVNLLDFFGIFSRISMEWRFSTFHCYCLLQAKLNICVEYAFLFAKLRQFKLLTKVPFTYLNYWLKSLSHT